MKKNIITYYMIRVQIYDYNANFPKQKRRI